MKAHAVCPWDRVYKLPIREHLCSKNKGQIACLQQSLALPKIERSKDKEARIAIQRLTKRVRSHRSHFTF